MYMEEAMKYHAQFFIVLALTVLLSGCAVSGGGRGFVDAFFGGQGGSFAGIPDGSYEGGAQGYRGMVRVRVRVEAGAVSEIVLLESMEDESVGGAAIEELLELVLVCNTTDLDAVSGATESGKAFLEAVENAILSP
jgi:major membrane immunogen (membrane-anchored lipoprotein)